MKYIAFLRGINVGGNSMIKMSELKTVFESLGFGDVTTYINSGNVIFSSSENSANLTEKIERTLLKNFNLPIKSVVKSQTRIEKIVNDVPKEWKSKNDLRCYVAFVLDSSSEKDVEKEIELKEAVDSIKTGSGVLYMTTKLSGLTKSSFRKLSAKKIYKEITLRNFNTAKKILALMQN